VIAWCPSNRCPQGSIPRSAIRRNFSSRTVSRLSRGSSDIALPYSFKHFNLGNLEGNCSDPAIVVNGNRTGQIPSLISHRGKRGDLGSFVIFTIAASRPNLHSHWSLCFIKIGFIRALFMAFLPTAHFLTAELSKTKPAWGSETPISSVPYGLT
jgi:hypothetical protein